MLYTEDTFEVPEYPSFGYLRGRYTQGELREIDDYAANLGVELVPCIQTLAHLAQFLQWKEAVDLVDRPDILMIDEPKTYEFIEAEISAVAGCIRSRRIHIGMDEAHGVGLGRYFARHGLVDRFELLCRHLNRVVDICKAYGLKPMMWSDMFFRLGSKKNDYYDKEAVVPQRVIDSLPDVGMVYWDYYHTDEDLYDHMLTQHARMGQEAIFAGGIWTWSGFLPQVKLTEQSMTAGLSVCARHKVDTVFATMWGDDGAETNVMLASSLLPIFSESCWQGPDCSREEMILAGECLTGVPREVFCAWGDLYPDERNYRPGKMLIWTDPLYPLCVFENDSMEALLERSRRALAVVRGRDTLECRYAESVFEVCVRKGEMVGELRERYLAGDRQWLQACTEEQIPALYAAYDRLMKLHRALWERDNKRFGWEMLSLRYGGTMGRLLDVQDEIRRYVTGELSCIEELEEEPMNFVKRGDHHTYSKLKSPAIDIW